MARYKHLPIYKLTYELLLKSVQLTKNFPKEFKYTLGEKLKEELMELVVLIYRANSEENRLASVERIMERIQVIELLIRLAQDLKVISKAQYANLVEMTESLGKQTQGWLNSLRRGEKQPESTKPRPR